MQLCCYRGSYINKAAFIFTKHTVCYQYLADLFKLKQRFCPKLTKFLLICVWVLSAQNTFCSEFPEQTTLGFSFLPPPFLIPAPVWNSGCGLWEMHCHCSSLGLSFESLPYYQPPFNLLSGCLAVPLVSWAASDKPE